MKSHGPQDDRDKYWTGGKWESQRQELTRKEVEAYEGELTRLRNENKSIRDQLNRSLKELHAYQVKYPSPYTPKPQEDEEGNLWTIAPEALNPLIEAYDTRLLELESTVKQQQHKLETFKERMEILVTENEDLRNKHLDELKHAENTGVGNISGLGLSTPLNQEMMAQTQQNIQLLMDENALLTEQKVVLSNELDKHQQQIEKQYQELHSMTQRQSELQKDVALKVQQIQQLQVERDEAAKHALHCSDALGKAEQDIESLTEQLALVKQKQRETELEYNDLKKQLKSVSLKYDEDGMQSIGKVRVAEERVKELHLLLSAKTQELENTNEVLRKLRNEYQSTRQDAEGMLQVMTGMERQLNEYASREDSINKMGSEARLKMEEAITIREQAAVKEEQSRREIERLMAERKAHLLQRQADIEKAVEVVRKNMNEQMSYYEKEIEELTSRNAQLIFEAERSARECKSTREMFERLQRIYDEQQTLAQENIKTLSEQLESVSTARETERALKIDVQEQNKELRHVIDKYRSQMESNRSQIFAIEKAKENEVLAIKQTNKELMKEIADKTRQLTKKQKDVEDLTHQLDTISLSQERKYGDEITLLRTRLNELEKVNKELDSINQANDVRLQMMVEQLKEKYNLQLMTLEAKLKNEMDKNKNLLSKARNNELLMEDLQEEKIHLQRQLEESKEQYRASEEDKIHYQEKVQELSLKLAESHNAREEGVYRAARAIEELNIHALSPLRSSFDPAVYMRSPGGVTSPDKASGMRGRDYGRGITSLEYSRYDRDRDREGLEGKEYVDDMLRSSFQPDINDVGSQLK